MKVQLIGGVDTVTGSRHLIEAHGQRVLRDCGLYQGPREAARQINRTLGFPAAAVDAVLLSHAHIDHCGNLPSLVKAGFQGPIYATDATCDLAAIMLRDAARIQEQDTAYLNQKTNRQGLPPVEPLYTVADAEAALKLLRPVPYHKAFAPAPGLDSVFIEAGHILGAGLNLVGTEEQGRRKTIGFAVDLGRKDLPLIKDPEILDQPDVLVMESTYGDRMHAPAEDARAQLGAMVKKTLDRGGKVLIPSFALERAQEILYHLVCLVGAGALPPVPVYLDSPMASEITRVFARRPEYLDAATRACGARTGPVFSQPWVRYVSTVEDSKKVTASDQPCVIIAPSGMCEHGRILHHLKHGVEHARNSILIVGYQAEYTLGRRIVAGEKKVRIFGDMFRLRAEVAVLNAFSAHADAADLSAYAQAARPRRTYLVHGEDQARARLVESLQQAGLKHVFAPPAGAVVEL